MTTSKLSGVTEERLPRLPESVERKIYKTGQTRGATPAEVFQNRVGRNSTVLIPASHFEQCRTVQYENGYIVLVPPAAYLSDPAAMTAAGIDIGTNALIFYTNRADWLEYPPEAHGWRPGTSRVSPLGGEFVARVPGTTAVDETGGAVREGYTSTSLRGAGIRVYEYASSETIKECRLQLEALIWKCRDSYEVFKAAGLADADIRHRREVQLERASDAGLLDHARLMAARMVDADGATVCPLCLEEMSAQMFSDRIQQAAGREVPDTTITEASLFHILELRVGELGHRPYNLGWGHHHCNVVAKDAGLPATLDWMRTVVARNDERLG